MVDPARVVAWPWAYRGYGAAARAGLSGERLAHVIGWRTEIMDRRVARHLLAVLFGLGF